MPYFALKVFKYMYMYYILKFIIKASLSLSVYKILIIKFQYFILTLNKNIEKRNDTGRYF